MAPCAIYGRAGRLGPVHDHCRIYRLCLSSGWLSLRNQKPLCTLCFLTAKRNIHENTGRDTDLDCR
jgi:hypothetical protein